MTAMHANTATQSRRAAASCRSAATGNGIGTVVSLLAALLLCALLVPAAAAQDTRNLGQLPAPQNNLFERQPDEAAEERTRISRRQASDLARQRFDGRVVSIRLDNSHWRVRMDQDGKVFNVLVDANSGAVERPQE